MTICDRRLITALRRDLQLLVEGFQGRIVVSLPTIPASYLSQTRGNVFRIVPLLKESECALDQRHSLICAQCLDIQATQVCKSSRFADSGFVCAGEIDRLLEVFFRRSVFTAARK